jgi:hypothetical protein
MKLKTLPLISIYLLLVLALPVAAEHPFSEIIPLPTGFQPEGITTGNGTEFFAASLADGAILSQHDRWQTLSC